MRFVMLLGYATAIHGDDVCAHTAVCAHLLHRQHSLLARADTKKRTRLFSRRAQVLVGEEESAFAECGDLVRLKVGMPKGFGEEDLTAGSVLCASKDTTAVAVTKFKVSAPRLSSHGPRARACTHVCVCARVGACGVRCSVGVVSE